MTGSSARLETRGARRFLAALRRGSPSSHEEVFAAFASAVAQATRPLVPGHDAMARLLAASDLRRPDRGEHLL